ncbi:hypothetical protein Tco_0904634 [Tanacetum coccineum]
MLGKDNWALNWPNTPPVSVVFEWEKQHDLLKPEPHMSPFDVFDDNQLDTQVNETDAQAQAEPQSNGTSDDINSLAMVVQSNVEPNEEPPTKKLKVMIDIPGPILLELYKAYSDNIPIDQFTAQLFGSGWFELHELASKKKDGANGQLLKNLKAKFKWVVTTAKKLNIPQLHQLTDHELPPAERKRKRSMRSGQVLKQLEARILYYNGKWDLVFQQVSEYALASTMQLMRTYKLIDVDSKYAQKMADELMWLIESRPDNSKARENVEKNLYAFGFDQPVMN